MVIDDLKLLKKRYVLTIGLGWNNIQYEHIYSNSRKRLEKIAHQLSKACIVYIDDYSIKDDCPTIYSNM